MSSLMGWPINAEAAAAVGRDDAEKLGLFSARQPRTPGLKNGRGYQSYFRHSRYALMNRRTQEFEIDPIG